MRTNTGTARINCMYGNDGQAWGTIRPAHISCEELSAIGVTDFEEVNAGSMASCILNAAKAAQEQGYTQALFTVHPLGVIESEIDERFDKHTAYDLIKHAAIRGFAKPYKKLTLHSMPVEQHQVKSEQFRAHI